ncbi:M56 family metallopeptidase [Paenibacillus sp. CC-CFT747]|nr:M56 family metallopeptidase [Paenibacillus sp. CC-CFT747]
MWSKRSRNLFLLGTLTAGMILLEMALYLTGDLLNREWKFNLFQFCQSVFQKLGWTVVGYVLDGLVVLTLAAAAGMLASEAIRSFRFRRRLKEIELEPLTSEINHRYGKIGAAVHVVESGEPLACTVGLWKPQIVLSTGLIRLLDSRELEAVLHHEHYHQKHGDPFKTFLLSLFASVFRYIPLLRWLELPYRTAREILADRYAMERMGSPEALGSALLKLLKRDKPSRLPLSYVSFAETSVNDRIRHILDPAKQLPLNLPVRAALVSASTFLLIGSALLFML